MTDFPIWTAALSDRDIESLGRVMDKIAAFEEAGHMIKADLEGLKYTFNRVLESGWKKSTQEPFFYNGKYDERTYEERELSNTFSIPYPHVIPGYLKRATAATKAAGPYRDALIAFLTEVAPVCARFVALKDIVGKRQPTKTKAAIAREGVERTCQVCGRGIFANTGVIAHHGYERPGDGWQTASCSGARELPFELSRDALAAEIERLKAWEKIERDTLANIKTETVGLGFTYAVSIQDPKRGPGWKITEKRSVSGITRENFETLQAENPDAFNSQRGPRDPATSWKYLPFTFDALKAKRIAQVEARIDGVVTAIRKQQARYHAWKQQATIFNGAWIELGTTVKTPNGDVAKIDGFYESFPARAGDIKGGVRVTPDAEGFKSWNLAELTVVE